MPVKRKSRFWKELLIGVVLLLIGIGFATQGPADLLLLCRKIIAEGVETNGIVISRETRRSARTRRGRITGFAKVQFSVIAYDGYRGNANFWPETDAVPVIYLKIGKPPQRDTVIEHPSSPGSLRTRIVRYDHNPVLIGEKSEGFIAIYNRNFRWGFVIFSTIMALLLVPFGALGVATTLWSEFQRRTPTSELTRQGQIRG